MCSLFWFDEVAFVPPPPRGIAAGCKLDEDSENLVQYGEEVGKHLQMRMDGAIYPLSDGVTLGAFSGSHLGCC